MIDEMGWAATLSWNRRKINLMMMIEKKEERCRKMALIENWRAVSSTSVA